jgi:uncharacterized membrane protein
VSHPALTPENTRTGILAGISAYVIWGLVPIFFKQIAEVPATEIIAHRVVWAMLLMTALIGFGRGFGDALRIARQPAQLCRIALASALVLANWLTFVWGVNNGHIVETSLGYFILPLLNVALGVLVLKERMRPLQWLAVLCAADRRRHRGHARQRPALDRAGAGRHLRHLWPAAQTVAAGCRQRPVPRNRLHAAAGPGLAGWLLVRPQGTSESAPASRRPTCCWSPPGRSPPFRCCCSPSPRGDCRCR